jgi:hypothetical protein
MIHGLVGVGVKLEVVGNATESNMGCQLRNVASTLTTMEFDVIDAKDVTTNSVLNMPPTSSHGLYNLMPISWMCQACSPSIGIS